MKHWPWYSMPTDTPPEVPPSAAELLDREIEESRRQRDLRAPDSST